MYAETFNNSSITNLTRKESFMRRPTPRQKQILIVLGNREMTARQIAVEMGFLDLNSVKPRLTELKEAGLIKTVGMAYDKTTERNVAIWRKI